MTVMFCCSCSRSHKKFVVNSSRYVVYFFLWKKKPSMIINYKISPTGFWSCVTKLYMAKIHKLQSLIIHCIKINKLISMFFLNLLQFYNSYGHPSMFFDQLSFYFFFISIPAKQRPKPHQINVTLRRFSSLAKSRWTYWQKPKNNDKPLCREST